MDGQDQKIKNQKYVGSLAGNGGSFLLFHPTVSPMSKDFMKAHDNYNVAISNNRGFQGFIPSL